MRLCPWLRYHRDTELTYVVAVPMLNQDGVINGNYRCNVAGFDLNGCLLTVAGIWTEFRLRVCAGIYVYVCSGALDAGVHFWFLLGIGSSRRRNRIPLFLRTRVWCNNFAGICVRWGVEDDLVLHAC